MLATNPSGRNCNVFGYENPSRRNGSLFVSKKTAYGFDEIWKRVRCYSLSWYMLAEEQNRLIVTSSFILFG